MRLKFFKRPDAAYVGGFAEIIVRLQEDARAGRKQVQPVPQFADVFAARVDQQIRIQGAIVERVHIGRHRMESVAEGCVERARDRLNRGIDVTTHGEFDVEARIFEQHGRQNAVPAAEHDDPTTVCADALEELVAGPHLAVDLLVVEGIGNVGLRMLRDDPGYAADEPAAGIGSQPPGKVMGVFAPIFEKAGRVAGMRHAAVVSSRSSERKAPEVAAGVEARGLRR
ncbi:hypothetical protein CN138_25170 [Sinorhizobium meliloti]|uniref:Uncharacterized protein n=2 Tax=Rhizobium meliloti TaxID=382 RepID=Q92VD6_RHIME|nr:hypothetical protein SMRU11_16010 [Sinorhizobium meliloti RU11/001]ASP63077.1 hypothetical protein CDO30_29535 [Sinorhizobium meliloti]CAC49171.1 hypothetical protein SM_b21267 [Sinorhizobium meliloti 1021]ASQ00938.1 hypothetical protein CDO24_20815 [Sinorhizobium meliloti]ATA97392.1 hypothetical protein BWO76_10790 [Sinorhizobium meliloti]